MLFFRDLRVAFHSLMRSKGLATIGESASRSKLTPMASTSLANARLEHGSDLLRADFVSCPRCLS